MEACDYSKKAINENASTFDRMIVQGDGDRSDTVTKIMPGGKVEEVNGILEVDTVQGTVI